MQAVNPIPKGYLAQHPTSSMTVVPYGSPENVSHVTPPWAMLERGFTFPSCNPIKRIDFLLIRNTSHARSTDTSTCDTTNIGSNSSAGSSAVTITAHWVVGTEPEGQPPPTSHTPVRAPMRPNQAEAGISVTSTGAISDDSDSGAGSSNVRDPHNKPQYREHHRNAELGMLDPDSPLWASDHFGVAIELLLDGGVSNQHGLR